MELFMINQPEMIDTLTVAFKEKQAIALSHAIMSAAEQVIEQRTKDVADLKDLKVLSAELKANQTQNTNRLIIWTIGTMFTIGGLVLAALRLL